MTTAEETLAYLLAEAERDHRSAKDDLVRTPQALIRDLERAIASVEEGMQVNFCGIVQTQGPKIDRLAATYMETAQQATKLRYYVEHAAEEED